MIERCLTADRDKSKPGSLDRPSVCGWWCRWAWRSTLPSIGTSRNQGWGVRRSLVYIKSREILSSSLHPEAPALSQQPRGSTFCFYVYMLCVGFSFLSTFQSLLNSVPVLCLSLPASATHALSQAVTFSPSTACAFLKPEKFFGGSSAPPATLPLNMCVYVCVFLALNPH